MYRRHHVALGRIVHARVGGDFDPLDRAALDRRTDGERLREGGVSGAQIRQVTGK